MATPSPGPGARDPEPQRGPAALLRSFLVVGVAVLVVAGLLRACSFAPGAPQVDRESVPRIDPAAELLGDAPTMRIPLRVPALPADWIPQSSDVVLVAGTRAARVGWVTPDDEFARLVQSDADEAALVVSEAGDPTATGTVQAGGRTWVTHTGRRGEPIWVADVDGVRLLVTGSATPERLTQLAEAALVAPFVVPR
ncbi:uncharacterized protein DUF4245 [Actinomycetospora succinea]|uniref:Uncharacterized protein DUF4245 n=1 Tax=Actinomycetospora succinea TaxID=663603 RepID=A0A4R6VCI6_9PSEU|nr:DUF4245 domain-containing protein [Actinomycetospora succinea]TDQ58404.1 uncharacterized protein DUF4245 [Actinomycetospora succinea]